METPMKRPIIGVNTDGYFQTDFRNSFSRLFTIYGILVVSANIRRVT